jgi:hypothetical protein
MKCASTLLMLLAQALDHVTIDRRRHTVMFVDDTGMLDGKPVNANAAALYKQTLCLPPQWYYSLEAIFPSSI